MLYLGYCNSRLTDGAGVQIQRILGIYAISRLLGYGYVHFGLSPIGYQGLAALEHDQQIPHLAEMYNTLISLPSDHSREIAHFGDQIFVEFNPDRSTIMGYEERSSAIQRDILLLIVLPFTASDEYLAGVAGNVRCVLIPRFWHALPPDWVETNIDTGVFDQNLVKQQLLRSRCQSPH